MRCMSVAAQAQPAAQVVHIPLAKVQELCEDTPALAYFLPAFAAAARARRPPADGSWRDPALNLMTTPVRSLIKRAPDHADTPDHHPGSGPGDA